MKKVKHIIKDCFPPSLLQILQYARDENNKSSQIEFAGNYKSWEDAYKECTGYDSDNILEKTKNALLKVKRGEAVYERDSVLFDEIHYSWPLLVGLLKAASENENRLSVLDFGGSLGSSYFQCIGFLSGLKSLRWSIVEQPKYVKYGREFFETEELKFYNDINECLINEKPNVVLLSSVIPYIEYPHDLLQDIIMRNFQYVILDRTPVVHSESDILTIQKVPSEIYEASYPAWFISEKKLLASFDNRYQLLSDFDSFEVWRLGPLIVQNKGYIFLRYPKL